MKPAKIFLTHHKKESLKSKSFRWGMNVYPMFFATGGKILFWSEDWKECLVRVKLNIWTRNYVNTIFGGSLFSATDPFYMIMWMHVLGKKNYVSWDKSASIRFKKPSKVPLYAHFLITDEQVLEVKSQIEAKGETTIKMPIVWKDKEQKVYCELEREIYLADKKFYQKKLEQRALSQKSK